MENPSYEYMMDGGLYDTTEETRTDVYVKECPGIKNIPFTCDLIFITGSGVMSILEISPEQLIGLGKWLVEIGKETLKHKQLKS